MLLTKDQSTAEDSFFKCLVDSHPEFVLTGFSGCGKTYLTGVLIKKLEVWSKSYNLIDPFHVLKWELTATTNKAAQVLTEELGHPATTIYSALGIVMRECHKTGRELLDYRNCKEDSSIIFYFIDEASYLSDEVLDAMRMYRPKAVFIFIGDPYQLPPVGTNRAPVFFKGYPQAQLTTIVRQNPSALQDLVVELKDSVKTGKNIAIRNNNTDICVLNGDEFSQAIYDEYYRQDWKKEDSKILAYKNRTVLEYNQYVREVRGLPEDFRCGDLVAVNQAYASIKTDTILRLDYVGNMKISKKYGLICYPVTLGGMGLLYTPETVKLKKLLQEYANNSYINGWDAYWDLKNHFIDLRDIFACTVHKSQGSTYTNLYLDMHDVNTCMSPGLLRRLKYVALSRAAKRVFIYV
jgi:hypothetical protein